MNRVAELLAEKRMVLERPALQSDRRKSRGDGGRRIRAVKRAWIDTPTHSVESERTARQDKDRDLPQAHPIRFSDVRGGLFGHP